MRYPSKVLLASRNQGKIKELSCLLEPYDIEVIGLDSFPDLQEVVEDKDTFYENSMLKASYAAKRSGLVSLADDSGLMVHSLGGAPGVFSARFSLMSDLPAERILRELPFKGELTLAGESVDERNVSKLLQLMQGVPFEQRKAVFCSSVVAIAPDGEYITGEGMWHGYIAEKAAGENGFGYDPIFLDMELGLTAAEMSPEVKNERSHRFLAMTRIMEKWRKFWGKVQGEPIF